MLGRISLSVRPVGRESYSCTRAHACTYYLFIAREAAEPKYIFCRWWLHNKYLSEFYCLFGCQEVTMAPLPPTSYRSVTADIAAVTPHSHLFHFFLNNFD